jgi:membrane protein implicated in regulation of membrane protease activity
MSEFLHNLEWWHWMVLAVLLAAAETLVPGAVVIWFAASAAVIGILMIAIDIPWQYQLIGFGLLGMAALLAYRAYRKKNPGTFVQPNLNQRGLQYIGSELVLVEAIEQAPDLAGELGAAVALGGEVALQADDLGLEGGAGGELGLPAVDPQVVDRTVVAVGLQAGSHALRTQRLDEGEHL